MVHQQPAQGAFVPGRRARNVLTRVPVWVWRLFMHGVGKVELRALNQDPITGVRYWHDIDFVGDHIRSHTLDVIAPADTGGAAAQNPLPVYVYFHGGGWTSGDKASLTKYCAGQAAGGVVVVNVNYRMAPHFHLGARLGGCKTRRWAGWRCTSVNSVVTAGASSSAAIPPADRSPH